MLQSGHLTVNRRSNLALVLPHLRMLLSLDGYSAPVDGLSEVSSMIGGSEVLGASRGAHHTPRRPQSRDHRPVPHLQPFAG
jgi:hypothetical protein